jgi:hypothetical protein
LQKLWVIIILLLYFNVQAIGQEQVLYQPESLKFSNISVDSALQIIENQTGLHFTFNSDLLHTIENVNAHFQNVPLCIILDSLFANPNLNYQIIKSQLVVYEQELVSVSKAIEIDSIKLPLVQFSFGGEIRDAETGETLPFAAISVQKSVMGTVSNEDGIFSLQFRNQNVNDSILISYLGYKALKIALNNIPKYQVFQLQSTSISLKEVIVRDQSPERLIRLAISNKKKNYPNHSFVQRAFYREAVKRDKKYMLYSEGILDVLKRPYRPSLFSEQVKLIKQRTFKSIEREDTVQIKLHGGVQTSLDLDVVKHGFLFIDRESMDDYEYTMADMVLYDGKISYKIEFKPKNSKQAFAFDGFIYLDVESLAFVKLEFKYTKTSLHKLRNAFVLRSSPRLKIIPTDVNYSVSYKEFEGRYYIHHIQGELNLKVKRRRKFLSSKYSASFEMVTTELNGNAPRRFASNKTIKTNKIFSDLSPNYDLNFWGSDNFLLPEMDLMAAFERLSLEK